MTNLLSKVKAARVVANIRIAKAVPNEAMVMEKAKGRAEAKAKGQIRGKAALKGREGGRGSRVVDSLIRSRPRSGFRAWVSLAVIRGWVGEVKVGRGTAAKGVVSMEHRGRRAGVLADSC